MSRIEQLRRLYEEIHAWAGPTDPELVPRSPIERSLDADVVLIGQALARDTQRLSGLPYTFPDGSASGGGRELAAFLGQFEHSIVPTTSLRYAHSVDLVPIFPGRNARGTGDKKPTPRQIETCRPWLERELLVIEPRVVVLMGALPSRAFLMSYADKSVDRLEEVAGRRFEARVAAMPVVAFPIYHPSGAWQFPRTAPQASHAAAAGIRDVLALAPP